MNEDMAEIRKVPDGAQSSSVEKEPLPLFPPPVQHIFIQSCPRVKIKHQENNTTNIHLLLHDSSKEPMIESS